MGVDIGAILLPMKIENPNPLKPYCSRCHRYMILVRRVPRLGALPELDTYRCTVCGDVVTVEHDVAA